MSKKKSDFFFEESEEFAPKNETTSTLKIEETKGDTNQKEELQFSQVDTGDFQIPRMTEPNDTFVGKFVRFWNENEGDRFNGIEFLEYGSNTRSILPDNYKLKTFFEKLEDQQGNKYDKEKTVFKIVRIGTKELDKGQSVALFNIFASVVR